MVLDPRGHKDSTTDLKNEFRVALLKVQSLVERLNEQNFRVDIWLQEIDSFNDLGKVGQIILHQIEHVE